MGELGTQLPPPFVDWRVLSYAYGITDPSALVNARRWGEVFSEGVETGI
jgi:hypothetical protein